MKKINAIIFLGFTLLVSCKKDTLPKVETLPATIKDATHVTLNGSVVDEGSTAVMLRGFCWALTANPTVDDNFSQNEFGPGKFTENLQVVPDTTYYIKAFATNSIGTSYGDPISFRTLDDRGLTGSFTDSRDNNVYNWVKIGNQVWMSENLAYLPSVSSSVTGSGTLPYFYVQGYEGVNIFNAIPTSNYQTYGVLYNWSAAMKGANSSNQNPSGVQGICPDNWHLPSDSEIDVLLYYLGNQPGKKMKTTYGWNNDANGDNSSGFAGLPGGYRDYRGFFWDIGNYGSFWTSTGQDATTANRYRLNYTNDEVWRDAWMKDGAYSIRCIRN